MIKIWGKVIVKEKIAKSKTVLVDETKTTFFDIAEKFSMLQGGSVYAKEIKDDITKLKDIIEDTGILEIVNMIIEIYWFYGLKYIKKNQI